MNWGPATRRKLEYRPKLRTTGLGSKHTVTGLDLAKVHEQGKSADAIDQGRVPAWDVSFRSAARSAGKEREELERIATREDGIPRRLPVRRPPAMVDRE